MTPKKIPFEPQMSVIYIRKNYAAPYLKYRYVYLRKSQVRTDKKFKEAMKDITKNWPDGTFYFKLSTGEVFVRFDVKNGKIRKIHKISPTTGRPYPVKDLMKRRA